MISLQKNVGRCHVNTGWASRMQSDRTLNPNKMVCPVPLTKDTMGRSADFDSLITKTAGCNNASDRVIVEDGQRPSSFSMVGLSNYGIDGALCNDPLTGLQDGWGNSFSAMPGVTRVIPPLEEAAFRSLQIRSQQWIDTGAQVQYYKRLSGCL